jgi:uncharacterized protein (DUF305 family)
MKTEYLYGLIGLLGGIIIAWIISTNVVNSGNTQMMEMMGIRSNSSNMMQNPDKLDAHFMEQMIPHHEDAITMAKLAQTKAKKPEVKRLAEGIIYSQGKEINQMKDWYKTWFGKEVPANNQVMSQHGMMQNENNMHMGMMGDATDISSLEKSTDFDRTFVEEMIPHHQMAVMMANMLKTGTTRPEMSKLADNIIEAQTREIEQMRQWLKDWE